ncbi:MAG: TauD/TfdA family dioxygenase [Actinomycetota bacterium]|nr:TauD/TfdA family dioxygenase [Actinomycetota bacterium]
MRSEDDLQIEPLGSAGGVEILDIDLAGDLGDATFRKVEEVFDRESLVVFRNQELTPERGRQIFSRFGPLVEGIGVVSNQDATGRGELQFHSERSFQRQIPIRGLALYGREVGAGGAATLFINCAAAYRDLPGPVRARLATVDTVHSFDPRVRLGPDYGGPEVPAGGWRTIHPAVLRHPLTGVPILFVSPWFTTAIAEDADAGDGLLDQMLGHLTDPSFRYRHQWRPNDLVLWDNLAFIHAREPYLESTTRVLWKYEFRFADGIELTPPHGTRLTTG